MVDVFLAAFGGIIFQIVHVSFKIDRLNVLERGDLQVPHVLSPEKGVILSQIIEKYAQIVGIGNARAAGRVRFDAAEKIEQKLRKSGFQFPKFLRVADIYLFMIRPADSHFPASLMQIQPAIICL